MENQALVPIQEQYERGLETFKNGSQILIENELKVSQIRKSGQNIINTIQAAGGNLTPELDQLCNDFIAKANQRLKEMNEKRAPITQMMTAVQKLFTSLETRLDIKKPDTEMAILQSFRNSYAKELAEERKRKQDEADKKAKKAQEAIQLKTKCVTDLNAFFLTQLRLQKSKITDAFNGCSIESFEEISTRLEKYAPQYKIEDHNLFKHALYGYNHSLEEIDGIAREVMQQNFEELAAQWKAELTTLKETLTVQLPSKKKELENMAKAGAEEKARLEKEKAEREEAEKARLKAEEAEAQRQAELKAQSDAAAAETMVLFEKESDLQIDTPEPESRQGFEIIVSGNAAYMQIFQLWWEHEGRSLTPDKMEKKTIGAMKKFCENLAHKQNIKIESTFLTYQPTYKAVNRK